CNDKFDYQYQLIAHEYSHSTVSKSVVSHENKENVSRYKCNLCGLFFLSADHLNNHYSQHAGERKSVCGQCKTSFKTETRYIHHIENPSIHMNNFECPFCSKKLSNKKYLKRHIKLHTRGNSFTGLYTIN
ncbi:Protein bowel, partial [Pseudolycoriella hygida]